jgi:UDP-N-acetylglucosamine 2-epimerase
MEKVAIILGTRPEIIKFSPIIRALQDRRAPFFIIHTGQHYSYDMDKIFFEELKLPLPHDNLDAGSGGHAAQTSKMLRAIGARLEAKQPGLVLVEGDTNSVLAGALAAVKLGIPVGHIGAGLRSQDRRMPEEINRLLTDHMSRLLFAPTEIAVQNLIDEGIGAKSFLTDRGVEKAAIYNVGNSIVDARIVVTDSGGVQEEACVLGVPCVTVRKTTERAETVLVGANALGGTELETMEQAFDTMIRRQNQWDIPYLPHTSARIAKIVCQTLSQAADFRSSLVVPELEPLALGAGLGAI